MKILLIASTTGYQVREFGDAARRMGLDLVLATDRCHILDNPWGDDAFPLNLERPVTKLDALGARIFRLVHEQQRHGRSRGEIFQAIWRMAGEEPLPDNLQLLPRTVVQYLDEPWYC